MSGQLTFVYEKRCGTCGETKLLDEFPRNKNRRGGRDGRCSECNRAAVRAWHAENREYALEYKRTHRPPPEVERARSARWRAANRERVNELSRQWVADNPEKRREISQAYYERHIERLRERNRDKAARELAENPERVRARQRAWKARNPEKVRRGNFLRRAHHMDDESQEWLLEVLPGDPCAYCGAPADHVDHIDPIALGGTNHWSNLAAACGRCNLSKNATPLLLWMARQKGSA